MSYSPLVDRERRAFGTRLTMLAVKAGLRPPGGVGYRETAVDV